MLQYLNLLSNFCSVVCEMVAYERLKTFSSKSGHGRLREVVGNDLKNDLEMCGILENWSLRRGGCLREVVATGGSTVFCTLLAYISHESYNNNNNILLLLLLLL